MARTCRDDLPDGGSEIFLQRGLDRKIATTPDGQITGGYSEGTRAASGEKFDARELTAAHSKLLFGTRLPP